MLSQGLDKFSLLRRRKFFVIRGRERADMKISSRVCFSDLRRLQIFRGDFHMKFRCGKWKSCLFQTTAALQINRLSPKWLVNVCSEHVVPERRAAVIRPAPQPFL